MSGVKHTPGPWEAYEQEARSNRWSVMGDDVVADLWRLGEEDHVPYPHEEGRAQANARLIASAPDLLEAAKPFGTAIMHLGDDAPDDTVIDLRMGGNYVFYQVTLGDFRRALNAIARARGEQDGGGE